MTPSKSHYTRAPIIEATLDLRVNFEYDPTPAAITAFAEQWKSEVPVAENLNLLSMGIQVDGAPSNPINIIQDHQLLGLGLRDNEKKFMVQVRRDGFAFINTSEYLGWEAFQLAAKTWWDRYRKAFSIKDIRRSALRYINRIEIPSLSIEPEDYLKIYLKLPSEGHLKDVIGFNFQAVFPQNDIHARAVVHQIMAQPTKPQHLAIMLDIDLFSEQQRSMDETALWDYFALLRGRKNDLFEDAITDKTRELIK